jgi:hypothetical protein
MGGLDHVHASGSVGFMQRDTSLIPSCALILPMWCAYDILVSRSMATTKEKMIDDDMLWMQKDP